MLRCSSRSTRRVFLLMAFSWLHRRCSKESASDEVIFENSSHVHSTGISPSSRTSHTHGDVSDHPSLSSVINFISRPPFGLFFGKIGKRVLYDVLSKCPKAIYLRIPSNHLYRTSSRCFSDFSQAEAVALNRNEWNAWYRMTLLLA